MDDDSAGSGDRLQVPPLVHVTMILKVLEAAPSLALITCGDDGKVVAATAGATAISGYERDQLLGTAWKPSSTHGSPRSGSAKLPPTRLRRSDGNVIDVCKRGFSSSPTLFAATIPAHLATGKEYPQ